MACLWFKMWLYLPLSHLLRGCVTVSEIVFVGQCEVFVCLDYVNFFFFFFPLGAKLVGLRTIFPTPTPSTVNNNDNT